MNKIYKKYSKKVLLSVLVVILFITSLNYFINPFNIFKQRFHPHTLLKADSKIQERLTKPIGLKIDSRNIDAVFIGTSRTDLCINKDDYKILTGKNAENIAIGGLFSQEVIEMVTIARKIHPEIENVFIELDFQPAYLISPKYTDINNQNRAKITQNPKLETAELVSALLTFKTIGASFFSIFKNLPSAPKKRTYFSNGVKNIFYNKNIENEFIATESEYRQKLNIFSYEDSSAVNTLIDFGKKLEQDGVNVKFYTMPTHISLQKLLVECNQQNGYRKFLTEIAKEFDIYDFNYPNRFTKEQIKPDMKYFFDGSHATYNLSPIIISDLTSERPQLARKITKDNAEKIHALLIKEIEREM